MAKPMRRTGRFLYSRSLSARRACVAACILGAGFAGLPVDSILRASDETTALAAGTVVHAVADGNASSTARPLAQPDSARPSHASQPESYVVPASGGIMGNWFGGQTKKAKKEHEDGRKATALPPPDPNTVDWSGVPFHRPKAAPSEPEANRSEPLRDSGRTSGSSVPSSTATMRRSGEAGTPGQAVSATRPSSSIPSIPATRTLPGVAALPSSAPTGSGLSTGSGLATSSPSTTSSSRSAISAPVAITKDSSTGPELSSSTSTRRSGRRPVDALELTAEEPVAKDIKAVPTEPAALTEALPAPSVPRRALMPVEVTTKATTKPRVTTVEEIPEIPKSSAKADDVAKADEPSKAEPSSDIPPVPESTRALQESWATVGSGAKPTDASASPTASSTASADKPSTPVQSTVNLPATNRPAAQTPTAPAPAIGAVVADATPTGPSPASERALREQLITGDQAPREPSPMVRKPEASGKQLAASELPGVRVVTEGPSEIMIRELTQYEVRVENRGSFDATGIVVHSSLPAWAEVQGHNASIGAIKTVDKSGQAQLQWTIDRLPAGVVERMFVRVKAIKAGTFDVATDWSLMPQKHVANITVREPKLAIVIDGPDEIVYGKSEKYRVRVMNPGDGDASNVVFTLSPQSKTPQSQKIGTIPAGKEAQFEIELTARELGELRIGSVAVADREVKVESDKAIRIAAANLVAELTGPPLRYQNSEAVYHLVVTNTGKAVCESLKAEVRLPMGVKYLSGVSEGTVEGDVLRWNIDALQPGAVREYDLVCKMDRTGEMVLSFACTGTAAGRTNVSIETLVEAIADLVMTIGDPIAPAPINTDVTYEMTITNRGSKAAEDVRVVAQFGHGIEPVRVEGQTGELLPGQVLFNPIARIEPGDTLRLKVIAKADRAGDHRFRTEVRHGETSMMAEESTVYMNMPAERISRRSTDR